MTDENSNVLVYLTGHGGEEFLKFQDTEEITSQDLADAFEQMWQQQRYVQERCCCIVAVRLLTILSIITIIRYNELLFIVDTCQANTLYNR
jgi:phosphatidylinositol glycan class K